MICIEKVVENGVVVVWEKINGQCELQSSMRHCRNLNLKLTTYTLLKTIVQGSGVQKHFYFHSLDYPIKVTPNFNNRETPLTQSFVQNKTFKNIIGQ